MVGGPLTVGGGISECSCVLEGSMRYSVDRSYIGMPDEGYTVLLDLGKLEFFSLKVGTYVPFNVNHS